MTSFDKLSRNTHINMNKNNLDTIISYCHLPPIDKNIKNLAMQKPTSILNKFITKHAKDIINFAEQNINSPIKFLIGSRNEDYKKDFYSKSYKTTITKSEGKNLNKNNINLSQKPYKKLNKISLGVLLTNIGKNEKKEKFYTINNELINNDNLNISEDNDININDLYDKYNNETKKRKRSIINTIKRESKTQKDSVKKVSNYFRRICSYQPDIKINLKFKYGLKFNSDESKDCKCGNNNISNQSKIINNHYKLLFNDINYYKKTYITDELYLPSFESLPLVQKINYNKKLEETIGILVLLPKLLLNDFFDLIKNTYSSKIPQVNKLEDKYVFDEVENLKDNNKLFFELTDYFQECYQIFQSIVKQFDKVLFKPKEFNKIISCFEKALFNISYINNTSEKAIDSYNKDMELINKLKGKKNKCMKKLSEKLRENHSFKNNNKKQKMMGINNSLTDRNNNNNFDIIKQYLINTPYRNYKMKSIINSKMVSDIMRQSKKDSKMKKIDSKNK